MNTHHLRPTVPVPEGGSTPMCFRLEYMAFRQMHHGPYLHYARVRTGDRAQAEQCVVAAFDALSTHWPMALRSNCPAAVAWSLLSREVDGRANCRARHAWSVHCLLEAAQADTVLLHHHLGLSVDKTAALMGLPDYAVRSLLRSAERVLEALPACMAARLGVDSDLLTPVFSR
ncbi:hypothetical protein ACH4OW_16295 [Streptomyces sp. NPDC017056]|uniref:hypothetical protein n=1 Tax=Streptomyces sp. NPDC017056 TaxID=3364973 RepID=UPI0037AB0B32